MKKYYYMKSYIDFIIAIILLIFTWPLMLIIGILIKIDSKGPIFFLQERLGQNGKKFRIYKFRTMVEDAINKGTGLSIRENDNRITKIGYLLRKTSIDELPQLLNIIKFEMSFVGPRPPVPYYPHVYTDYSETQKKRFLVKPGVTGYAQVKVRNNATWDERINLDIEYVDKFGIAIDIKIILKSFDVVIRQKNIYPTVKVNENVIENENDIKF